MPKLASLIFLLLASLVLAGAARGAVSNQPEVARGALAAAPGLALVEVGDEELGEDWEEDEEEGHEAEEAADQWEAWEEGGEPPSFCQLRSADARATLSPNRELLRVTVRYTTFVPVQAMVDSTFHGAKGPLRLPAVRRQLGARGVLHISQRLNQGSAKRARVASEIGIRFRVQSAPAQCAPVLRRQLDIRSAVRGQLVWRQSDSAFGLS